MQINFNFLIIILKVFFCTFSILDESFILPCIKVDDELISVITDVEENEEGTILALPGFLSALPMEVRRVYIITLIYL